MTETLKRIWDAQNLYDLERLIRGRRPRTEPPLAFTIDLHSDQLPTVSFRYALWHPHDGLDLTRHWLHLCRAYLIAANTEWHDDWVTLMDHLDVQSGNPMDWSLAIQTLGVRMPRVREWSRIAREFMCGRRLSRPFIDRYGVLDTIRELRDQR
ncbi:hypothetical protein VHEMI08423 [[Torrubiella] hemipterigena]|uniref:Uncharacterized protein n=1 Tax=[Torrubiella] hemipterigena TaxID=1531966 RepID=A0A0A1TNG8_9HYPO|nr:hypothetical protein VHEMI08423 [[Torrubiella] hemipterigena]